MADEVLQIRLDVDTKDVDATLNKLNGVFNAGMGAAKAFIGSLVAVDAAILGLGVMASQKAAEFEALEMSLVAVEGSAQKAKKAIEELRDIAKGPGLGVQSAIETYAGLRRGGLDSQFSMDLTRNLGNAIAYTGGGKEELGRIAIALNQIAVSPTLRGQDVMQLAQARLPIYGALKSAFGTADTAELDKMGISSAEALRAINEELAKLPKVAGGAKNTIENIFDTLDYALIQVGDGINKSVMPLANEVQDAFSKLTENGTLQAFGEALGDAFTGAVESITNGAKNAQEVLDDTMTAILTVAYASRNAVLNIQDLFDIAKKLIPQASIFGDITSNGALNPYQEAQATMKAIQAEREMRETLAAKKPQKDVMPEEKPAAPEETKPATNYLRQIEQHTRTMSERLTDMLLGGGAATDAAVNERNLARWSGTGSSNKHMRMIQEGFQGLAFEMASGMAKAGTFRRAT